MKSSRRKRQQTSLSLFPFLAVLICTMGVLIVLLVIVVKHADNSANQVRHEILTTTTDKTDPEIQTPQPSSPLEDLTPKFEKLKFAKQKSELQIELLADVRDQVRADLEEKRQFHSNVHANINDLRDQAMSLSERLKRIETLKNIAPVDANAEQHQLTKLTAQIESVKQQLKESTKTAMKPSYAIVPFRGTGRTNRRPIFVECTGSAIILQPYGIKLLPSDFQAPMLAGNPLDAALLTIRDFLHSNSTGQSKEQPYPLLIVRPDGAISYSKARHALKSWVDEFGYELVPEEMELSYPPANPQLVAKIEQTIKAARIRAEAIRQVSNRQVDLSAIERNQYGSQYHQGAYQGGSSGPGSATTNSPSGRGEGTGLQGQTQSSSAANGLSQTHQDAGGLQSQLNAKPVGNSFRATGSAGESSIARTEESLNTPDTGSMSGRSQSMPMSSTEQGSRSRATFSQSGFEKRSGSGNDNSFQSKPNQTIANGGGYQQAQAHSSNMTESSQSSAASTQDHASTARFGAAGSGGNQQQSQSAQSQAAQSQSQSFQQDNSQQAATGTRASNLAESRGEDWALMSKQQNGTAYRRRIYLDCSSDRLTIKSAGTSEKLTAIILTRQTAYHIDELIDQVWRQVDNWGVAGGRSYWKPQLMIRVKQGGMARATEIQTLLENSGLDVLLMNQ